MKRGEFIGAYVTPELKEELVERSKEENVSLSSLVSGVLSSSVGLVPPSPKPRTLAGRKPSERARLTHDFRNALIDARSVPGFIHSLGWQRSKLLSRLLASDTVPVTKSVLGLLTEVAKQVQFNGKMVR